MTAIDDLIKLVEDNPWHPVCHAMLEDELMESRGMLPEEARRCVEHVSQVAHDARAMRQATELLRHGTRSCQFLHGAIRRELNLVRSCPLTVLVVPGNLLTRPTSTPSRYDPHWWGAWTMTAGADWLVHVWLLHVRQRREAAGDRRARRRPR